MTDEIAFRRRRVLIVGGSLAGLIAGNLLHRTGWDVDIFKTMVLAVEPETWTDIT